MYILKNDQLEIGIQHNGAELCSIKNLENNKEYMWQADPEIWGSHAPNLFPVIGALKGNQIKYEGKFYDMPRHGFIRHNENLEVKNQTETSITFSIKSNEELRKIYPFEFEFELSFTLKDKSVEVNHLVKNLDTKSIYFQIGGHPAFNAPLFEGETYEDYYLEFDQDLTLETYLLGESGLVSDNTKTIIENSDRIQLTKDLFNNDALIFKNITSKNVSLKSKNHGSILSVSYDDFKNLGVWAKPGAPYVCIEPWLGIADVEGTDQNFKTKEGIIELETGKDYSATYTITIA
ncbi:aldose 1-epimerase family protein [Zunongwangia sp. SCSIO 43204]|uniref:aldose 1-epimerase family protein n=1 Tax=Zunongwangia sp. SCSIO 43204 TaxID=2779359 RepID=UPI001CA7DA5A|nr:aldose 1-epimerase family protein [Zunongwangia sp. SCSIO 43204]UAB83913.1 aldose 1-epimerase family protein [Zunongwangia sp. SCSIO 43204]